MWNLVAVGEPAIDFERIPAETKPSFRANVGGGCLNVLAAAARQGCKTAMLGCVGDDMFGNYLISAMEALGVDARGIKKIRERSTGIGFVSLKEDGEREFAFYRDYVSPVTYFAPDDEKLIENAGALHYTSVSLAFETGRTATRSAVTCAQERRVPLSFDINYRPSMWKNEALARRVILEEIGRAVFVKTDEYEARFITGESEVSRAAAQILTLGPRLVCITLGANGSYYAYSGGKGFCPSIPVRAVDTTGCGDAFTGVLLHALLHNGRLEPDDMDDAAMRDAVRRANVAGALCALKKGAADCMPDADDIERAIASSAP